MVRKYLAIVLAAFALGLGCTAARAPLESARSVTPVRVPIYRETIAASPHQRFFFSTRPAGEAERFGWRQLGIAF